MKGFPKRVAAVLLSAAISLLVLGPAKAQESDLELVASCIAKARAHLDKHYPGKVKDDSTALNLLSIDGAVPGHLIGSYPSTLEEACEKEAGGRAYFFSSKYPEVHAQPACEGCTIKVSLFCREGIAEAGQLGGTDIAIGQLAPAWADKKPLYSESVERAIEQVGGNLRDDVSSVHGGLEAAEIDCVAVLNR